MGVPDGSGWLPPGGNLSTDACEYPHLSTDTLGEVGTVSLGEVGTVSLGENSGSSNPVVLSSSCFAYDGEKENRIW